MKASRSLLGVICERILMCLSCPMPLPAALLLSRKGSAGGDQSDRLIMHDEFKLLCGTASHFEHCSKRAQCDPASDCGFSRHNSAAVAFRVYVWTRKFCSYGAYFHRNKSIRPVVRAGREVLLEFCGHKICP